jgi:putative CocE/NonD family hydrolase
MRDREDDFRVCPVAQHSMRTRDGVRLDADVYRPDAPGPFPVLLMRQPYGRGIASTVCYAHPNWYAARGYVVVVQDVRGRGTSAGTFRILENEVSDGAEATAWAAALPGTNGAVGMYGFSYQGTGHLLAAGEAPHALKAVAPAMIGWDLRTDWAYENDAFCLQGNLGWAIQIGAETARLAGDAPAFDELYAASRALPFGSARPVLPGAIERWRHYTHYHDFLTRRDDSEYWQRISPAALSADVSIPLLFVGGWFDSQFRGTLAAYKHFAKAGRAPVRLIIGPWAHIPWGRRLAGIDFGPAAGSDIDLLQVQWFDHWLKGRDTPIVHAPPVRLFDMGRNAWREFAAWPQRHMTLYLAGSGRAAVDQRDGTLLGEPPPTAAVDFLVHDPWRPAPAVGGAFGTPVGPADRSAVDARGDVMTFTTRALERELRLAGDVSASLWLACDAPSFDVGCVLSRVTRSGQVLNLAQGYRHLPAPSRLDQPVAIPMRATCASIAAGEALRLSIAAACFPAYPVNPGNGLPPEASLDQARITTLGVRHGGASPSSLQLGMAEEDAS